MMADSRSSFTEEPRVEVLYRIEVIIANVLLSLTKDEAPHLGLDYPVQMKSTKHTKTSIGRRKTAGSIRFDSIMSVRKFGMVLHTLSQVYELLQQNLYATKRDMYYQNVSLYGKQYVLDSAIDAISSLLEIPRWNLHVMASTKGLIAGDLHIITKDGSTISCSNSHAIGVPYHVDKIRGFRTQSKFILVIEKDATFRKLLELKIFSKLGPCIMVTGKGYPDVNTRMLLKKLWDRFALPTFVLVDADPHGIEIMLVYKYGSAAMSSEREYLAVPDIQWIGLLPSELDLLRVSTDVLLPLTKADKMKARDILCKPDLPSEVQKEVEVLALSGFKGELQSLDSISDSYITDFYLLTKLKSRMSPKPTSARSRTSTPMIFLPSEI